MRVVSTAEPAHHSQKSKFPRGTPEIEGTGASAGRPAYRSRVFCDIKMLLASRVIFLRMECSRLKPTSLRLTVL